MAKTQGASSMTCLEILGPKKILREMLHYILRMIDPLWIICVLDSFCPHLASKLFWELLGSVRHLFVWIFCQARWRSTDVFTSTHVVESARIPLVTVELANTLSAPHCCCVCTWAAQWSYDMIRMQMTAMRLLLDPHWPLPGRSHLARASRPLQIFVLPLLAP